MRSKEYAKWKSYLKQNGYDDASAVSAAKKIMAMDSDLKEDLQKWADRGIMSERSVEGFRADELVDIMGFHEVAAFLMLDWLKRDPNAAKMALGDVIDKIELSNELLEGIEETDMDEEAETDVNAY